MFLLAAFVLSACTNTSGLTLKEEASSTPFSVDGAAREIPEVKDDFDTGISFKDARLRAYLELPEYLLVGEEVNLKFILENESDTTLYVLKWYTPLEGIAGEIFKITHDGQPLPYEGISASRTVPTIDSYVIIQPGESVSVVVDLGKSYDFTKVGIYQIGFISPRISHIARSESEIAKTYEDLVPVQILSNPVTLEIRDK
jgi:hypothetical protein